MSFIMDLDGPVDLDFFQQTSEYPDLSLCTCILGGEPDGCLLHRVAAVDEVQSVPRIDQSFDPLWQPDSNLNIYPPASSHFTDPVSSYQPEFNYGQLNDQLPPSNQFARLHLSPEQPLDPSYNVLDTYAVGDRISTPVPGNADSELFPQLQLSNGPGLSPGCPSISLWSDPGPDPGAQPLRKRPTYAEAAAFKLDTQQPLPGGVRPAQLRSPQAEFRFNPPAPDATISEPVRTKPSQGIRFSFRSRAATRGTSSYQRETSPARSVLSNASRRSGISRRSTGRRVSSTSLTPASANLRCQTCGTRFDNRSSLNHHELKHIANDDRPHVCKVCSRGFLWEKDLIRHMPKHTKEKIFNCGHCSKAFTRHDNLRRHYNTEHQDIPPPSTNTSRTGTVNSSSHSGHGYA